MSSMVRWASLGRKSGSGEDSLDGIREAASRPDCDEANGGVAVCVARVWASAGDESSLRTSCPPPSHHHNAKIASRTTTGCQRLISDDDLSRQIPPVAAQALIALLQQRGWIDALKDLDLPEQGGLETVRDFPRVAVRATERFLDDLIDQTQLQQARRGNAQRFGGILGAFG